MGILGERELQGKARGREHWRDRRREMIPGCCFLFGERERESLCRWEGGDTSYAKWLCEGKRAGTRVIASENGAALPHACPASSYLAGYVTREETV